MGEKEGKMGVETVGNILKDATTPLKKRYRALFTLKNLGGPAAVEAIGACFSDPSALLKHECAYCLGQMQDKAAIPILTQVLRDTQQDTIVRHEAGEALGAIGSSDVLKLLEEYASHPIVEISETCQLAIRRIKWLQSPDRLKETLSDNPYKSVDPAPPCVETNVEILEEVLLNETLPLYERYRAMFSLRNKGDEESVLALAKGLNCSSALFRHEVAYVLGQMQHPAGAKQLMINLKNCEETAMVRHECAEALGAIASDDCMDILKDYLKDPERVVKESCEVALDMGEYETSDQFQYADGLSNVTVQNCQS